MATFLYSGPSGDQYEKWKKEYLAEQEAEKAKTIEAEVVAEQGPVETEVTKAKPGPKPKTAAK